MVSSGFRKAKKGSCTANGREIHRVKLSCFFSVQNRWGARENHGEKKREYNSNQNFNYKFFIIIDIER